MKNAIKNFFIGIASVVIFFGVLELIFFALNMGTPFRSDSNFRSGGQFMMMKDKFTGLRPKPGFQGKDIKLNSFGARDEEINQKASVKVICLGDSTTFGWGLVNGNDAYCNLLEKKLNDAGGTVWETVNAGVPSYTLYQGMQFFYVYLRELTHWDYALVTFGWNENPDFELDLEFAVKNRPIENKVIREAYTLAKKLRTFNVIESFTMKEPKYAADPFTKAFDQYVANYQSFLRSLKASHIQPIVLPVLYSDIATSKNLIARMQKFNRAIEQVAKAEGVSFAGELETRFRKDRSVSWFDSYHYDEAGHKYIADYLLLELIRKE